MFNYRLLGVFTRLYGENAQMTFGRSLLISVVGFVLVIIVLLLLALVVKGFSALFGKSGKNETAVSADSAVQPVQPVQPVQTVQSVQSAVSAPVLEGIGEEQAAVVMAVVSYKTGIPLNRLQFNSIKLSEDK